MVYFKVIVKLFITLFGLCCHCAVLPENPNRDIGDLIFSSVLFRHGERTPDEPYANDPYGNESDWPVPFGQLTSNGQHQQLMLGKWLRLRYKNFLPEHYSPYDIYVRSSDYDRTLMSAQANLAGLYPATNDSQTADSIGWTSSIPVHTVALDQDYLLDGTTRCPRYYYELKNLLKSPFFIKIHKEYSETIQSISKFLGKPINSILDHDLVYFYDTLYIERIHNKTISPWAEEMYTKLIPLVHFAFSIEAHNYIMKRLKIGLLLGEIVNHMVMKSRGSLSPDRKMWMYSGHDRNIANLLMALNVFEPQHPPFAAVVLIELWRNSNNQYFVTVSYKNSTELPTVFTLPGCKEACPLDDFVQLTNTLIPTDLESECLMDSDSGDNDVHVQYDARINIMLALMALLTSMELFLVLMKCWPYCIKSTSVRKEN